MGEKHGGQVTQKPIGDIAMFIKSVIPANIPEVYALKPRFANVAREEDIRNGVVAFRDFLYLFCDRLITDGQTYAMPPKKPKSATDYPFLYQITDLLVDMGYYGELAENGNALLLSKIPSFIAATDEKGNIKKPKNPVTKLMECLRFLALCGFNFSGIDLEAKTLPISEAQLLKVSYLSAPVLLTGLKAMAIADMELRIKRYVSDDNHDNLLRCDYRALIAEDADPRDILKDFLRPLPEKVQRFAFNLHERYTDRGMTCAAIMSTFEAHIAYSHIKNSRPGVSLRDVYQKRVWEFALSMRDGYCLVVRAKKTEKYADVIEKFPLYLREKIASGYGCDRKLRNEPCQRGCQGLRLPLDDSIADIGGAIETWLDNEVSC